MKWYTSEQINDHLYVIKTRSHENVFLIVGDTKALLIDTSIGIKGLRDEIERLSDRALLVALSHGHLDHAYGIEEFETVYMNAKDRAVFEGGKDAQARKDYIYLNANEYPEERVMQFPSNTTQALYDGRVFDLGNIHVEAIECGGHTPGSMLFLLQEDRILITGDACNTNTFLFMEEALPLYDYMENLERVEKRLEGRYDRIFLAHGPYETSPAIIKEGIHVCEEILAGHSQKIPFVFLGSKGLVAKKAAPDLSLEDGTAFNIVYDPEKLHRFPQEIEAWIQNEPMIDSSSSQEAKVYLVKGERELFLKIAPKDTLRHEAIMDAYFHLLDLCPAVLAYAQDEEHDYLLTDRATGSNGLHFLDQPKRLAQALGHTLRTLHTRPIDQCPKQDLLRFYLKAIEENRKQNKGNLEFLRYLIPNATIEDAKQIIASRIHRLKCDTLIHGDYCLPNIFFDEELRSTNFIDLDHAGVFDRHIDLYWGMWTLFYNLKTDEYRNDFLEAYGKDRVDQEMLELVAACEVFG